MGIVRKFLNNIYRISIVATYRDNRIANKTKQEAEGKKAIGAGEAAFDDEDLLSIFLESNFKEIEEHGNKKNVGMSIKDIIKECKMFYFAGRETTSSLLVWTIVLLSRHPNWQARAREEVLEFALYKALITSQGDYTLQPQLSIEQSKRKHSSENCPYQVELPITLVHHDTKLWGDNANEFRPERFANGISKATNG
ncbi:Cytochrome P [Parasponia andersonii]|uniref:Cytochrome P n=1 Tax=Parasponia andersonii TaxID=3476 RepID=A0A2P5D955_PARAD|nr:Cytochrome P [Parasponia andersonii]